jgi:hypothetical protein
MLIRFLNGQEIHVENSIGRGFIASGQAAEVTKPATKLEPKWCVWRDSAGYVGIRMELGALVSYFHGDPDRIHDRKDWRGRRFCSAFGVVVPTSVIEEYRASRQKDPDSIAPLMPYRPVRHDNVSAARELEKKNKAAFKPVVTLREALDAQRLGNQE